MATTEADIFACLNENFRLAAEDCEALAKLPAKGPTYSRFRERLELLEGACRQAGFYRDDSRWFDIGRMMAEAHKRAGSWLRGWKSPDGKKVTLRHGELHPRFVKLAENLRAGESAAKELRTRATLRIGPVLPEVHPAPHRDTRPVGWTESASGILIPA